MARKTRVDDRQASLFPTAQVVPDSRPAEVPRRPADDRVAAWVAPRPSKPVKSPPEASAKKEPRTGRNELPWIPLEPEEVADFEAAFGRKVIRGARRFELREDGRLVPVWRVRLSPVSK